MKQAILTLTMTALSVIAMGQEAINFYTMSSFEGGHSGPSFSILATEHKGEYNYYIDTYTLDGKGRNVVIVLDRDKEKENFMENLHVARDRYAEWDSISVANNITDLRKNMGIRSVNYKVEFYMLEWEIDYTATLTYIFQHIEGVPCLYIYTGGLNSATNQYIESQGGLLIFNSLDEIDSFIEALDEKHAVEYFSEKSSKESFFEN